ncbi:MAG TPA: AI-2E family transporter [Methylomirabilota bacterium]|nr:AI-2E family transporter [Methylomirabilota bacterium]
MNLPPPSPQQARIIWLALTGVALAVVLLLVVVLVWGLGKVFQILGPVLWPIAMAGVLAYLLDPMVDFFQSRGVPRTRAILLVFGMAVLVALGLLGSVVPQMVVETRELAGKVPTYASNVQRWLDDKISHPPEFLRRLLDEQGRPAATTNLTALAGGEPSAAPVEATGTASTNAPATGLLARAVDKDALQSATGLLARLLPRLGSWLFGQVSKMASWFGVLAGLALVPVYTFYFLAEKSGIASRWTDYLPVSNSAFKDELVFVLRAINEYLIVFFRGQVLVAVCDGVLYTIGFIAIGLPYAVLLGVLATILTMIPFLGAIITCVAALVIAVAQFGDWLHPALVLAVFAVVQTLEGLVISPKIMGDRVGLHPLTIIIAVMVGTTLLGGILGGLLAIPLTAALRVLMFRYVWKRPAIPNP